MLPETSAPAPIIGIDTSHWQSGVNWPEVAKTCTFAITKATTGLAGIDPLFAKYWAAMKACGIIRGVYHFFMPLQDPAQQADHFLSVVGALEPGDLLPTIDVETLGAESYPALAAGVKSFVAEVYRRTGLNCIIYADRDFLIHLKLDSSLAADPLWLADYNKSLPSTLPAPFKKVALWQNTETGAVAGAPGKIDGDVFEGSRADLLGLTIPAGYGKAS